MKIAYLPKSILLLISCCLIVSVAQSQQAGCPSYGSKIEITDSILLKYPMSDPKVRAGGDNLELTYLVGSTKVNGQVKRFSLVDKLGNVKNLPEQTFSPTTKDYYMNPMYVGYTQLKNGNILAIWSDGGGYTPAFTDVYFKILDITGKELKSTTKINTPVTSGQGTTGTTTSAPATATPVNYQIQCEQLANGNLLFHWIISSNIIAMRRFTQAGTPIDTNQISVNAAIGLPPFVTNQYTYKVASDADSKVAFAISDNLGAIINFSGTYPSEYTLAIFDSSLVLKFLKVEAASAGLKGYYKDVVIKALPKGRFLMAYKKLLSDTINHVSIAFKIFNSDGTEYKSEEIVARLCRSGKIYEPLITNDGIILHYGYDCISDELKAQHLYRLYDFNGVYIKDLSNCFPISYTSNFSGSDQYEILNDLFVDVDGGLGLRTATFKYQTSAPPEKTALFRRSFGPPVYIDSVIDITKTAAKLYGSVGDPGDFVITERGFIYANTIKNTNPLVDSIGVIKIVSAGTSSGSFNEKISGLDTNTAYAYKAYVKTSLGAYYYSKVSTFSTNQPPKFLNGQGADTLRVNVAENVTTALTFQVADPDGGQTLTYKLFGSDAESFMIDQATGNLSFKTAPDFEKPSDSNKDNVFVVYAQVADNGNFPKYDTVMVWLTITNVPEKPTLNSLTLNGFGITAANVKSSVDNNGGGGNITEQGFVISIKSDNPDPNIGGSGVTKFVSTDPGKLFSGILRGLSAATTYVVNSFATNSVGTSYWLTPIEFTTLPEASGPFIVYPTPQQLNLKQTIAPLIPIQGGTPVPATVYKNISTFAGALGTTSTSGSTNATGTAARFNGPRGMAMDIAGNIYVAEKLNHTIRKITPAGVVSTLAGTAGSSGSTDATGAAARFNAPEDMVIDPTNTYLYVTDRNNHKIRKIDIATGVVTTFAGTGSSGSSDNYTWPTLAQFNQPSALTIDTVGNLYISDYANNKIRKISPITMGFDSTTNNALHFDGGDYIEVGGTGDLNFSAALTVEAWVKVDAFDKSWQSIVTKGDNSWRLTRSQSGNNLEFTVTKASGGNFMASGSKSINDGKWHHVVGVYNSTSIQLYVDGALDGQSTGSASSIQLSSYKTAIGHNTQQTDRKWKGTIDEVRIWSTARTADQIRANMFKPLQGNEDSLKAYFKLDQGTAGGTNTGLTTAINNAISGSSINGTMTGFGLTGTTSNWVKSFNNGGWSVATFAGTGTSGAAEGNAITTATFNGPQSIAISKKGVLYVSEIGNHKIRKIQNGVVSTLAGSVQGNLGGAGTAAKFNQPYGMALDGAGNIYVAEFGNNLIKKITPEGVVSTFVGTGTAGSADTAGVYASFNQPSALLMDQANNTLYVSDYAWNKIRSINMGGYELSNPLSKGLSFDNTTGIINGKPIENTVKTYYYNQFNDTALKGARMYASTMWAGDYMLLTPAENTKAGAFLVPASGKNESTYKINFTLITGKTTGGADGISYSFADDAAIDAITPAAQVGTGTKLSLSFDDYENTGGERGIRLMYGAKADNPGKTPGVNGLLAYSNNIAWIGKRSNVDLFIDTAGKATVSVEGQVIFDKVSLPAAFKTSDKSTWKHVFRAATGGANDIHGIDNLMIGEGTGAAMYNITANNGYGSYTTNLPIQVAPKPLPKISYGVTTTQSYSRKSTITPLTITNTGGSVRTTGGLYGKTTLFAGSGNAGISGNADGQGANARFNSPKGIVFDPLNNVLYVADKINNTIRKITKDGRVTTFAGTVGTSGYADGDSTAAKFFLPESIVVDGLGNVFVGDNYNYRIRKITPQGNVSTFAGKGVTGYLDGQGTAAQFALIGAISIDASNNLFVADQDNSNQYIRKVTPTGLVSTFTGGPKGNWDAPVSSARFNLINGLSIDASNNIFVMDYGSGSIRKIVPNTTVIPFIATVSTYISGGTDYEDGSIETAKTVNPVASTIDEWGNIYVSDTKTPLRIRKISNSGIVSTINLIKSVSFGMAVDDSSNLFCTESNNCITKINLQGYRITPALPEGLTMDSTGTISGTPTKTSPKKTYSIVAFNEMGSDTTTIDIEVLPLLPKISYHTPNTFIKDSTITPLSPINKGGDVPLAVSGIVSTIFGGGSSGYADGVGLNAIFSYPKGLVMDKSGNMYVADYFNFKVRKITPNGTVSTLAGSTEAYYPEDYADTTAAAAKFRYIEGIAVGDSGNVYVTDPASYKIRKISPAGVVTTLAGSSNGYANGIGSSAKFGSLSNICTDSAGNIYAVEGHYPRIRKITPGGEVSTYAGSGKVGYLDGQDTSAQFEYPTAAAMDRFGNLYVTENFTRIRKISPAGKVSTFAGSNVVGYRDGKGTNALFNGLSSITVDAAGNVYVADVINYKIRKITPDGEVTTVAGTIRGNEDGSTNVAKFSGIGGISIDSMGNFYIADMGNNSIRKITNTGYKIVPSLPKGLSMDSAGNIVGTPTAASPLRTYTVYATNEDGTDTTTLELSVNATAAAVLPTITTAAVSNIATTTVSSGGVVTADGGAAILDRGVVWSTTADPTIALATKTSNSTGVGSFISSITGLLPNTLYYIRAYATNSAGTAYGSTLTFTTSVIPQQGAKPLSIAVPTGSMRKAYDGNTNIQVTPGALTGLAVGDVVAVNARAGYTSSAVGNNKQIIVTYTLSGADAAKYTPPANDTIVIGEITPKQLLIEDPLIAKSKIYDGTTNVNAAANALIGLMGSDVVTVGIKATYNDKNVGTGKQIKVVYSIDGASAGNYIKPVDTILTDGVITKAELTVKAKADAKFAGENDAAAYKGVVITGYVNGETDAVINQTALSITRSNSLINTAGDYSGVLVTSGLTSDNYSFAYINGDYSIIPADQLLVRLKDTTITYGSTPVYAVESAQYFKTGASLIDLTATTNIKGDTVIAHDGAVTTIFNIIQRTSYTNRLPVGSYVLDTTNVNLSANVTSVKLLGNLTVKAKPLTVNSSGGATKVYDASKSMNGVQLQLNGTLPNDNVIVTGIGSFNNKQVGTKKSYSIASLTLQGMDVNNYYLSGADSIGGTDGVITTKQLTIGSPTITTTKLVDGNDTASVSVGQLVGVEAGEDLFVKAIAKYNNATIGSNKLIKVSYRLIGADTANYIKPADDSVTNGIILDTLLTIGTPTVNLSKFYDGSADAAVTVGALSGINPGDEVIVTATANYNNANVDTNKIIVVVYTLSGAQAYKYSPPKNDTFTGGSITAKQLVVTDPNITITKTYDGTTAAAVATGTLSGMVNGDNVTITAIAQYDDKNVGSNKTIYVNYTIDGTAANNYIRPTNYTINTGTITPATLTVQVIKDAKFVGEADPLNYKGVSISGYVNGETIAELDTTALVISRDNSAIETAGDYDTVLNATGLLANNYTFNYVKGNYSIVPADHLLVKLHTTKTIYGEKSMHKLESAKYLKSAGNVLVDLTATTTFNGDTVLVIDGATQTKFTLVRPTATFSSADRFKVGSYILDTVNVKLSNNVVGLKLIGAEDISAKAVAASTEVSKVYDGTTSMSTLQLSLDSLIPGDKVNISGSGNFDNRNVGINKSYQLQNMQLIGLDASNYYLTGGSNSISGTNGVIAVKQLLMTAPILRATKIFDSSTKATILVLGNIVGVAAGDDVVVNATAHYNTATIGKSKLITVQYTLTGKDTANYMKPVNYIDSTGEILPAQSLEVSIDTLYRFVACEEDNSAAQFFEVSGVGLNGDINITAPNGFELSTSINNGYDSILILKADNIGTVASTAVFVRMKSQSTSPQSGNIVIVTNGVVNQYKLVSGTVHAKPKVDPIVGGSQVCKGAGITLTNASTGGEWSSNNTGIATINMGGVISGVAPGSAAISYKVTSADGCTTAVTKIVTVDDLPAVTAITGATAVCVKATIQLMQTANGGRWSSSDEHIATVNASGVVSGIAPGTATLTYTATNSGGCSASANQSVLVNPLPIVSASINNSKVSKGQTALLSATGIGTYAWTPAADVVNADKATTVVKVMGNTVYKVTVTDANGCSNSAEVSVEAIEDFNVSPPSAFTPNGDGINDRFVIKNIEAYPENQLMVYDRSGKLVYEARNYANTWDGKIQGFDLGKDSYFYLLLVKGRVVKRGAVTLVQ